MLRIILVRHGVTTWNLEDRRSGHTDIPLADEGVEQAKRTAERLYGETPCAIWTSDLQRAWKMAAMIAKPHNLISIQTPLLRERCHGSLEGLHRVEIDGKDVGADNSIGAETPEDVWDRTISVRQQIQMKYHHGTIILVGHGGPIRMLICDALGLPMEKRGHFRVDNASVSLIEYADTFAYLTKLNDTNHL